MEVKKIDIDEVLSCLTLHEKIGLVTGLDSWHTFPVHRLGIPSLRISDGPNGVRGTKFFNSVPTSCIPTGTALASCWNPDLMFRLGKSMGQQARAKGAHMLMGPNINMTRSPLSGRSFETYGEDPFLSGILALAYCQGVHEEKIMVCPKHMVCNDKEDFRMTMNVDVSERALREIYLMPFMLTQKYADPEMYMTAYNKLNGVNCSENTKLMQGIVRNEWGFDGCFISDWFGTVSCADSINAGLNLEMPGPTIWRGKLLEMSLFHNTVSEDSLDNAVRGVLSLVNRASESGIPENAEEGMKDDPETTELARQAARESIVLMKNSCNVLPLKKDKKVLVIGEGAVKVNYACGGCTHVTPYREVLLLDSLKAHLGASNVDFCVGAPNRKLLPSFSVYAKSQVDSPIKFSVYDDPRNTADRKAISEEMVSEIDAILGDFDPKKLRDANQLYANFLVTVHFEESGYYKINLQVSGLARVYVDGMLQFVNDLEHKASGAFGLDAPEVSKDLYFDAGKDYLVEIDFESTVGKSSFITGYGCVACGIERAVDPVDSISEASLRAKDYDQVILITGLNKDWECEGVDRKTMDLPPHQDALVESVLKSNPNAVVVIESGTAVTLPWAERASSIVHSGYIGEELGNALFDVLFGFYNPSGKLPFTWPVKYADCSSALSFDVDKDYSLTYLDDVHMGYRYLEARQISPLFAFGHGLSYTSFKFHDLRVSVESSTITLAVDVRNLGKVAGDAVVQAYVDRQDNSLLAKSLKGFTKVHCGAGETVTATVTLDKKLACSFYNTHINRWTMEKGERQLFVGTSSDAIQLEGSFDIEETVNWISFE